MSWLLRMVVEMEEATLMVVEVEVMELPGQVTTRPMVPIQVVLVDRMGLDRHHRRLSPAVREAKVPGPRCGLSS